MLQAGLKSVFMCIPWGGLIMERTTSRRQIMACLTAAVIDWPTIVSAQSPAPRLRRIGVMMAVGEADPEGLIRLEAFRLGLAAEGWIDGQNATIEVQWYRGNFDTAHACAKQLIDRGSEIIVVNGTPGMEALRALTVGLPIVFTVVSNPVGAGYVTNLSHPGGNITGFSTFEPEMAGKWLQLLRQAAPGIKHVAMLLDPKFTGLHSLWQALQEIAPRQGIATQPAYASNMLEIERTLETFSQQEAPGLIVGPSPVNTVHRQRLIEIAAQRAIPAIYPFQFYVREGALLAYGFNATDQFKRAASYVSRILKGEKVGDLPVQAPSLFELGVNLKTAKVLGLTIPQSLLIAANEIVE